MDTWIDMYHGVRRLAQQDTVIFLTDNAVGAAEEENLQHLVNNLAGDVPVSRVVPFLTCKHSLEYCLTYAARAAGHGFEALTVLGGDKSVGPPRCVEYAYQLRREIRRRLPVLALGGWANPHGDPGRQVDFLLDADFTAEFYLTQVVSHHSVRAVEAFVTAARRRGVTHPAVFGVFLYRSARPETLARLAPFFPVPAAEITREFDQGLTPEEICARSIRALRDVGVGHVYVSNLGFRNPERRYRALLEAVQG
jgi:5,10-methylenetetrahydrofolate reductase